MPELLELMEMRSGKLLKKCEIAVQSGDYRLYVDRFQDGFYAMAVEWCSSSASFDDHWLCPSCEVEQIFIATAYSDGVRHLEFNRGAGDMAGYIGYPSIERLMAMLSKVRELELELCRYCEKSPTNINGGVA